MLARFSNLMITAETGTSDVTLLEPSISNPVLLAGVMAQRNAEVANKAKEVKGTVFCSTGILLLKKERYSKMTKTVKSLRKVNV